MLHHLHHNYWHVPSTANTATYIVLPGSVYAPRHVLTALLKRKRKTSRWCPHSAVHRYRPSLQPWGQVHTGVYCSHTYECPAKLYCQTVPSPCLQGLTCSCCCTECTGLAVSRLWYPCTAAAPKQCPNYVHTCPPARTRVLPTTCCLSCAGWVQPPSTPLQLVTKKQPAAPSSCAVYCSHPLQNSLGLLHTHASCHVSFTASQ